MVLTATAAEDGDGLAAAVMDGAIHGTAAPVGAIAGLGLPLHTP